MAVKHLKELNQRHHLFIALYLEDFNATRAAKRAGFSEKTAHVIGSQLLKDPLVFEALKQQREAIVSQLQIDLGVIFREYFRVAFADLSDLLTWDDTGCHIIPSTDLTPRETAAIQEIIVKKRIVERVNDETTVISTSLITKVKLHDKLKALEALIRLLPRVMGTTETDDGEAGAGKGLASLLEVAKQLVVTAREDT